MTLMLLIMGRHAERENLFGDDVEDERKEEARVKYQLLPGLVAYVAGGALGLLSPRRRLHLPRRRHLPGDPDPRRVPPVPAQGLSRVPRCVALAAE